MKLKSITFCLLAACVLSLTIQASAKSKFDDSQYVGQFDTTLAAYTEDTDRVIFNYATKDSLRGSKIEDEEVYLSTNRLQNPVGASLVSVLVEVPDAKPMIFVDINADNAFSEDEKFTFKRQEKDNPYLWITTVSVPIKDGFFKQCPIFIRYFRDVKTSKMNDSDRLIEQSTKVMARGAADVNGKKVLVQYEYSFEDKKVTPEKGWLGVDADENGEVDMDSLSPEAAKADNETIVFRVGQTYVSTKKADVAKNQIVLREHQAKDYKRLELAVGKELPDFSFVDLNGKKRKISEFRGKYLIVDFWGFWCPPCRAELPYLREAYKRFQSRGLEIVGMNTDEFTPESIKKNLSENQINWTQGRKDSFVELRDIQFRIESFPSTFLVAPDGKILSMSRQDHGELDLRGKDLLTTLDKILPGGEGGSHE